MLQPRQLTAPLFAAIVRVLPGGSLEAADGSVPAVVAQIPPPLCLRGAIGAAAARPREG